VVRCAPPFSPFQLKRRSRATISEMALYFGGLCLVGVAVQLPTPR
jgi:hypothetical protein